MRLIHKLIKLVLAWVFGTSTCDYCYCDLAGKKVYVSRLRHSNEIFSIMCEDCYNMMF